MQPKLVPGCQTPAKDGTVIVTDSQKVQEHQRQMLEGLLLNHPLDCPVCDKAGECGLQDYSYRLRPGADRMVEDEEHTARTSRYSRPHLAVHRPLHHVHPLRPVHPRDHRDRRAAGDESRQPRRDRRLPRRTARQPAGRQRRRPVPRRGPAATRTSSTSSASGSCKPRQRLHPMLDRLQHQRRGEQGHRLPAPAAGEPAGARLLHVRRGPVRLQATSTTPSASAAMYVRENGDRQPEPWPRPSRRSPRARRGRRARRRSVAGVLSPFLTVRGGVPAGQVPQGAVGRAWLALGPVPIIGQGRSPIPTDRRGRPDPSP